MFAVQEIIISCLYARAAHKYLQDRFAKKDKTRNAMCLLMFVQVLAIAFDFAIVFMDFAGYLQLKFISFSLVYAIKLELEFVALNQLVELSGMGVGGLPSISFAIDAGDPTDDSGRMVSPPAIITGGQISVNNLLPSDAGMDLEHCQSQSSRGTLDSRTALQRSKS